MGTDSTPMINAGMIFSDIHYGGINYPIGGFGRISKEIVPGIVYPGYWIRYGARVTKILFDDVRCACSVSLFDGSVVHVRIFIINTMRWDTFDRGSLVETDHFTEAAHALPSHGLNSCRVKRGTCNVRDPHEQINCKNPPD